MVKLSDLALNEAEDALYRLKNLHEKEHLIRLVQEKPEVLKNSNAATDFICQLIADYTPPARSKRRGRPKATLLDVTERRLIAYLSWYHKGLGYAWIYGGNETTKSTTVNIVASLVAKSSSTIRDLVNESKDDRQPLYYQMKSLSFQVLGLLDSGQLDPINMHNKWKPSSNDDLSSFLLRTEVTNLDKERLTMTDQDFYQEVMSRFSPELQTILKRGIELSFHLPFIFEAGFQSGLITEEEWSHLQSIYGDNL